MNSSFLRQNNLTKTIAQIDDCLFIYMKFKAMDHAFQHGHRSTQRMVRLCMWRTELRIISGCCRKTLNSLIILCVHCVAVFLEANSSSQRHNNGRLITMD